MAKNAKPGDGPGSNQADVETRPAKEKLLLKQTLSAAVRKLREEMGITQQEFAYRLGTAIRTVTRWENNHPPHGQLLLKLAQLADAHELRELADRFVGAIQRESNMSQGRVALELKAWSEGLTVVFEHRYELPTHWLEIARNIKEGVQRAVASEEAARSKTGKDTRMLHRQLADILEGYE